MDWKALAELLAARCAPALVIDRTLQVRLFDERLAALLELEPGAELLEGSRMDPLWELARRALEGILGRDTICTIVMPDGVGRVELTLRGALIDSGAVLVVCAAVEQKRAAEDSPAIEYEIEIDPATFGHLRRLTIGAEVRHYFLSGGPRCHEVLHHCSVPCADCPLLAREPRATTVRERAPELYEVLEAERLSEDHVRLSVQRVRAEDAATANRGLLEEAALGARLSALDRAVLAGFEQPVAAAAATLGTSPAHVRRRRVAVLRRLGRTGRAALLRLLV
ncbi:MAG: hypothetical protein KIT84_16695 [Labilithrix sp.]|nr:hypothetical protein [Labilithrix sp.]MCW5812670.1 hypothetical protein [Labilithrix sp.]